VGTDEVASVDEIKSFNIIVVDQVMPSSGRWNDAVLGANRVLIPVWNQAYGIENPNGIEQEEFSTLNKELKGKAFTGILATHIVARALAKQIIISGFTFYEHMERFLPYQVGSHLVRPQLEWLYRLSKHDARVIVDEQLKNIFARHCYERQQVHRVRRIGNEYFFESDCLQEQGG
jgi:hypothetical protein